MSKEMIEVMDPACSHEPPRLLPARIKASFYRPELDALRFFAFFGVYVCHFFVYPPEFFVRLHLPTFLAYVPGPGGFGVDLFFLLSAYLITELLMREKQLTGSLNLRKFYIRRILRIWPLYFAFLGLAALPFFNTVRSFAWLPAFLLLSGNWSLILQQASPSILGPLWSVSVEEQFYLSWAPVVGKLSRKGIILAAVGMFCVATLSRVAIIVLYPEANPTAIWENTFTRLDPIAVGILLAVLLDGRTPELRAWKRSSLWVCGTGILFIVGIWRGVNGGRFVSARYDLISYPAAAFGCALIFLSVLGMKTKLPTWLIYLGKISYGLYVIHLLGAFLADSVLIMPTGAKRGALRVLIGTVFTFGLASLSYRYLETPFLRLKDRFAQVQSRPV